MSEAHHNVCRQFIRLVMIFERDNDHFKRSYAGSRGRQKQGLRNTKTLAMDTIIP